MEPTTTQITPCFPNDIWPEISHHLHAKSLHSLSQVCHFFEPICQPYLKVTEVFFDMFTDLQSEYCQKERAFSLRFYYEGNLAEKIFYSRINQTEIEGVKKHQDKKIFSKINMPFYPSLLERLKFLCRHLKVPQDILKDSCDKLEAAIKTRDFKTFEEAVKFIPMEELRELNSEDVSVSLFDHIKQCDFAILPVLNQMIECDTVEEPLRSNCIGANIFKDYEPGINDIRLNTAIYYLAKILKINLAFRTEFCQKEILDAVEIVNKNLLKEFPFS